MAAGLRLHVAFVSRCKVNAMKSELGKSIFGLMALTMTVAMADVAVAATMELAMAQCKETGRRSYGNACARKWAAAWQPGALIPGCKAQVTGQSRRASPS